jgi:hypothetical protein
MTMFNTDPQILTARKQHRCTSCGEAIQVSEKYHRWVTFDDTATTSKMHPECLEMHQREECYGEWEYSPYSHERPLQPA